MDYAKLALLKAEQLSRQTLQKTKIYRKGFVFQQTIYSQQEVVICEVFGNTDSGIIVSLCFKDIQQEGSTVDFIVDNKTVFTRPLSSDMLFMASLNIVDKSTIKIKTNAETVLVSAEVMAIGGQISGGTKGARVDILSDYVAAVMIKDNEIRLSAGLGVPSLSRYEVAGFGSDAAVAVMLCGGKTYFAVCFVDLYGNLAFTLFDTDMRQVLFKFLQHPAESCALVWQRNQLALGWQHDEVAYVGTLTLPDFQISMPIKVEEAKSIEFIKDSAPPSIIVKKGKNRVIRLAVAEEVLDSAINLNFQCISASS